MFNYRAPKYIRKAVEKYDQESIWRFRKVKA
jgi:hypothetical protein